MVRLASQLIWLALSLNCVIACGQLPASDPDIPPTILDEPAQPLSPLRPRGEERNHQLKAAALFAHGRLLLKRESPHAALQHFQRAWRYDPGGISIARDIVPLASSLKRRAEAARYAILGAEQRPADYPMLRQLGALLISRGEPDRALRMFDRAAPLESDQPRDDKFLLYCIDIGRLHSLQEDWENATARFEPVVQALKDPQRFQLTENEVRKLDPRMGTVCQTMANAYLQIDQFGQARFLYGKANEFDSEPALLAFHEAKVATREKNWPMARRALDTYFAAQGSIAGPEPYRLLASVLAAGEPTEDVAGELIDELTQLAREDTENLALGYFLAARLLDAGRLREAEEAYLELLDRRPAPQGFQALVRIYHQQDAASKMLKLLTDLMRRTGSLNATGDSLDKLRDSGELVGRVSEAALQTAPASAESKDALLAASLLAVATGRTDLVMPLYEAALTAADNDLEVMEKVGLALLLADEAAPAAEIFQGAIAEDPPDEQRAVYLFYLAGAQAALKQNKEAIASAEAAAKLKDTPRFQSRPAWLTYFSGDHEAAAERYSELLEQYRDRYDSDQIRDVVRDARLVMSNIRVIQNRLADAEEWLELVLDEFPEDIGALNDLGYLWADQGKNLERALEMVQRAVQQDPENAAYRDSLGWAYYKLNRYDEAIRELKLAIDWDNPDGVILDHLGDAYLSVGQTDQALRAWQRATEVLDEGSEETLRRVREKLDRNSQ